MPLVFRSRASAHLLGLLAARYRQDLSKSALMATLWPDSDGDRQAQNLRKALADVRAALGLEATDTRVIRASLDTLKLCGGFEVDLEVLRAASECPKFESRIFESYRGPLLEGWEGVGIESARSEAEHLFAAIHLRLLPQVKSRNQMEFLRDRLVHSIALVPLREDLRVALIEAHSRLGERHEALRQLESLSTMLDDEFGESPSNEAIRALNFAPDYFPNLEEETYFEREAIGRRGLVQRCLEWVPGTGQLTTLIGVAGVGKTTTAKAVVRVAKAQMAVAWVELAPLQRAADLWPALARSLGAGSATSSPEALRESLAQSPILIVFDNAEHLLPNAAELIAEVAQWPGTQVLVTSRRPLEVPGERLLTVENLEIEADENSGEGPAVRLFLSRLRDHRPHYQPSVNDLSAIVEICERVDGHPFSLDLIANDGLDLPPAELLALLRSPYVDEDRGNQLTRLLSHGFSSLSLPCQDLLKALSVLPGHFDLLEAEALVSGSEEVLHQLVKGSFLKEHREGYQMPFVVREFVRPQVAAPQRDALTAKALLAYAERTRWARARAAGPEIAAAMRELGSVDATIYHLATIVIEEADQPVLEAVVECAFNLYLFLQSSGRRDDWRQLVQKLLAKSLSARHQALLHFVEGQWQMAMGDIYLARAAYKVALETPSEALLGFEPEAFEIAYLVSHTIRGDDALANAEWVVKNLAQLREELEDQLEREGGGWDLLGVKVGVASTLGASLRVLERHHEAIQVLGEARELARASGHWRAFGLLSHGLADNAMDNGNFALGAVAIQESLGAYEHCGIPGYNGPALEALGLAYLALGQFDQIPQVLDQLEAAWDAHRANVWSHSFFILATTLVKRGVLVEAKRCCDLARSVGAPQAVYGKNLRSFLPAEWLSCPVDTPPEPVRCRLAYARHRRVLERSLQEGQGSQERFGTS